MRDIFKLLGSVLVGMVLYISVFAFMVHRPMTVDSLGGYVDRKLELLRSVPGRRILILAGSNGRFSHSCEEIQRVTGIPAVNLSINAEISLNYQFNRYLPWMNPGDLVYLPLEYRTRHFPKEDWVGAESSYLFYNHTGEIPKIYSLRGIFHSAFNFDVRYLISSLGEMALNRAGVQRRFNLGTLNKSGDEFGHDASKSVAYRALVNGLGRDGADRLVYTDESYWKDLEAILGKAHERGIICVGGLPTTFDDFRNVEIAVKFLTEFYKSRHACFIALPNRSLYPRSYFYDTAYHLQQEHQIEHSRLLAPRLKDIFTNNGCLN